MQALGDHEHGDVGRGSRLAPLRQVLVSGTDDHAADAPHAVVLAGLWERTARGMSDRWRRHFAADYGDFLDAFEQEAALRRSRARLSLADYTALRRRTITHRRTSRGRHDRRRRRTQPESTGR
ncbi:terpene synthase family protein [Streptomyces sp. NPDC006984]|uniref:terpene synthase family protein n=1 Tax=Streptomyces sp. NPDC006984 TaxID=3155463 RepID=UPI0033EAFBB2